MLDYFHYDGLDAGWQQALTPVLGQLTALEKEIKTRAETGETILPAPAQILRAFTYPLANVKVLIVGQDPYPTPGNAVGLSFSTGPNQPVPASLRNIFTELAADIPPVNLPDADALFGQRTDRSPDLSSWARQGVCLLNRVLTVTAGQAGSHRRLGWQAVTEAAISSLISRGRPLSVILWGNDAQQLKPLIPADEQILVLESAHPSPLSARRGFFGSKPFSQTNNHLRNYEETPIDWWAEA